MAQAPPSLYLLPPHSEYQSKAIVLRGRPNLDTDVTRDGGGPEVPEQKRPGSFYPWWEMNTATDEQKAARGKMYQMRTSYCSPASVWIADTHLVPNVDLRYFCHGWGLGTFNPFSKVGLQPEGYTIEPGYTVSTAAMANVILDPALFRCIREEVWCENGKTLFPEDSTNPIESKDIVAWWGWDTPVAQKARFLPTFFDAKSPPDVTGKGLLCSHTAIIEQPVYSPNKAGKPSYLDKSTGMSSKNGGKPLQVKTSLGEVMEEYRNDIMLGIYRKIPVPAIAQPAPTNQEMLATWDVVRGKYEALTRKYTAGPKA